MSSSASASAPAPAPAGASLAGQVALVTGASRGIGRGCAIELGARGATVFCTGRRGSTANPPESGSVEATAAEVTKAGEGAGERANERAGGRGIGVVCDHRDDDAVERLFAQIKSEEGRLDILVNNAFIIPDELTSLRPFWEVPLSNWDDMVDVGTRSAYAASRLAAPMMIAQGKGLIANISSSGAQEYAWHVAYGVGKAALDRFTADAAHELVKHGVAVVSLWPGLVLTERNEENAGKVPGLDFSKAESLRFTGRAIAALASDAKVIERTGQPLVSRDLADEYGFTDVDGSLPNGPLHRRGEI